MPSYTLSFFEGILWEESLWDWLLTSSLLTWCWHELMPAHRSTKLM
jgi:hypothetical protein